MKKFLIPLIASASLLLIAIPAYAAPLSGYAWSSNIGWISFNSADSGAGGGPYSVQIATTTTTGTLSGYAWSPNIGWVSFNSGDVASCPSGSCTPTINMLTGTVSGWARAITGAGRIDGWDGWIELSGANHVSGAIPDSGNNCNTYVSNTSGNCGVVLNTSTGAFSGYAWGSDVVGWLSFNTGVPVSICPGGVCSQINTLTVTKEGNGTGAVTSNPLDISCSGTTCTETVASPIPVTLTATPDSGSTFTGWSKSLGFTPSCSGTGTCAVTISGAVGVTATFTGPTISLCNLGLSGQQTSPYILTIPSDSNITSSIVNVIGGVTPYTYLWSVGPVGNYVSQATQPTYNLTSVSGNTNYSVNVKVQDSSSPPLTSDPHYCGSVTVTNNTITTGIPIGLWFNTSFYRTNNPPNIPTQQQLINVSQSPKTVRIGSGVTLDYTYPSNFTPSQCIGAMVSGTPLSSWVPPSTPNLNSLTSSIGSTNLTGLLSGIYKLNFTCTDSLHPSTASTSNTVEIDVTNSGVQEK